LESIHDFTQVHLKGEIPSAFPQSQLNGQIGDESMDKTMDEDAAGPSSESANLTTLFQFF